MIAFTTWVVPAGSYDYGEEGSPIPGTYHEVDPNLQKLLVSALKSPINGMYGIEGEDGIVDVLYDDLDVAMKDLKFTFGEYKHIHRVAYVGGQKWLSWFTRLIGPFTRAEEKHFTHDQFQAAFDWVCG